VTYSLSALRRVAEAWMAGASAIARGVQCPADQVARSNVRQSDYQRGYIISSPGSSPTYVNPTPNGGGSSRAHPAAPQHTATRPRTVVTSSTRQARRVRRATACISAEPLGGPKGKGPRCGGGKRRAGMRHSARNRAANTAVRAVLSFVRTASRDDGLPRSLMLSDKCTRFIPDAPRRVCPNCSLVC
jgi:hypothetical protein